MVAWAALAQAAATAAPSVMKALGPGKNQHVDKDPNFGFVKLVKVAQNAGFNPLTALRATGGAGAGGQATQAPQLSSLDFMADALGRGVETYFNVQNQRTDEEADRLRVELMKEELHQLRTNSRAPAQGQSFGYDIPTAVTTTQVERGGPVLAVNPDPQSEVYPNGDIGANRKNPREFETDAWDAAVRGKAPSYFDDIARRNGPDLVQTLRGSDLMIPFHAPGRIADWITGNLPDWSVPDVPPLAGTNPKYARRPGYSGQ